MLHSSEGRRLINMDRSPELSQMTVYFCQTTVELITVKQDKSVLLQNSRNWSHSRKEKALFTWIIWSLCPKLSWSWDWCKTNPGEKIQQVTSVFCGTIKNSITLREMTFHSFNLQCNTPKSNQRIIWINEAVCPSLHSQPLHAHAEEAWWVDGGEKGLQPAGEARTFMAELVSSGEGAASLKLQIRRHPSAPQTVQTLTIITQ